MKKARLLNGYDHGIHTSNRCTHATSEGERCAFDKYHTSECSFDTGMHLYLVNTQGFMDHVVIDGYGSLEILEEYEDD